MIDGLSVVRVDYFCYLVVSAVTNTSSCDKDIKTRICKAYSAFKRLVTENLGLLTKVQLYELIILTLLLYSAEIWSVTEVNQKRFEAFHHTNRTTYV